MIKSFSFALLLFLTVWEHGEGLTCYNCYTLSSSTRYHGRASKGEVSVPCADNITESNTYVCPDTNSVCTLMQLRLGGQNEILRGCAKEGADICNTGIPGGVEVVSCTTCKTDLCNGDTDDEPNPPDNNSTCPSLTFDVNLNINMNVYHVNAPNPIA